jgi:hypothetical protein
MYIRLIAIDMHPELIDLRAFQPSSHCVRKAKEKGSRKKGVKARN